MKSNSTLGVRGGLGILELALETGGIVLVVKLLDHCPTSLELGKKCLPHAQSAKSIPKKSKK